MICVITYLSKKQENVIITIKNELLTLFRNTFIIQKFIAFSSSDNKLKNFFQKSMTCVTCREKSMTCVTCRVYIDFYF